MMRDPRPGTTTDKVPQIAEVERKACKLRRAHATLYGAAARFVAELSPMGLSLINFDAFKGESWNDPTCE